VPLENSLVGSIYENYDLIRENQLSMIGEEYLAIEHHLCLHPNSSLTQITHVCSHPKALEQISNWLRAHPHITPVPSLDTASGAEEISLNGSQTHGAICSQAAAEIYGLQIVERNLEDNPHNVTRFGVIALDMSNNTESNKCSLMFSLPHIPKALFHTLEIIVSVALNTTKIESRPIAGKPFEYIFYLDFEFNPDHREDVSAMLVRLKDSVPELRVLGFYKSRG